MSEPTVWVPLEQIRMPAPVHAGMNLTLLTHMTYRLRTEHGQPFAPIQVQRLVNGGYQLLDGRHRLIAHHAAGRQTIPATVTP